MADKPRTRRKFITIATIDIETGVTNKTLAPVELDVPVMAIEPVLTGHGLFYASNFKLGSAANSGPDLGQGEDVAAAWISEDQTMRTNLKFERFQGGAKVPITHFGLTVHFGESSVPRKMLLGAYVHVPV